MAQGEPLSATAAYLSTISNSSSAADILSSPSSSSSSSSSSAPRSASDIAPTGILDERRLLKFPLPPANRFLACIPRGVYNLNDALDKKLCGIELLLDVEPFIDRLRAKLIDLSYHGLPLIYYYMYLFQHRPCLYFAPLLEAQRIHVWKLLTCVYNLNERSADALTTMCAQWQRTAHDCHSCVSIDKMFELQLCVFEGCTLHLASQVEWVHMDMLNDRKYDSDSSSNNISNNSSSNSSSNSSNSNSSSNNSRSNSRSNNSIKKTHDKPPNAIQLAYAQRLCLWAIDGLDVEPTVKKWQQTNFHQETPPDQLVRWMQAMLRVEQQFYLLPTIFDKCIKRSHARSHLWTLLVCGAISTDAWTVVVTLIRLAMNSHELYTHYKRAIPTLFARIVDSQTAREALCIWLSAVTYEPGRLVRYVLTCMIAELQGSGGRTPMPHCHALLQAHWSTLFPLHVNPWGLEKIV